MVDWRPYGNRVSVVILRSSADGGMTKNLEILRTIQSGTQDDSAFLRGACPERLDLSSSTGLAEGLEMTNMAYEMTEK